MQSTSLIRHDDFEQDFAEAFARLAVRMRDVLSWRPAGGGTANELETALAAAWAMLDRPPVSI